MCARPPVARAASMTRPIATFSASRGREARKSANLRPEAVGASAMTAWSSAWTMRRPSKPAISARSVSISTGVSGGNSSTPESSRKHLKPKTPASWRGCASPVLPGIAPPQKPTSTKALGAATARFVSRASTSTVGGRELSGMSRIVVTPPAAAAFVAEAKPSHSPRPGSLTWTWVSTRPGRSTCVSSTSRTCAEVVLTRSSPVAISTIRPSRTATSAAAMPSGRTARFARMMRSTPASASVGVWVCAPSTLVGSSSNS